jgi:hypothetical protein
MIYLCHLPNFSDDVFVVYDKEEFKPEDFELEPVKEITLEELKSEYNLFPLLKLDEFLLGVISNKRTNTRKLAEHGIETFKALVYERELIHAKRSKLSRAERDLVLERYDEILNL